MLDQGPELTTLPREGDLSQLIDELQPAPQILVVQLRLQAPRHTGDRDRRDDDREPQVAGAGQQRLRMSIALRVLVARAQVWVLARAASGFEPVLALVTEGTGHGLGRVASFASHEEVGDLAREATLSEGQAASAVRALAVNELEPREVLHVAVRAGHDETGRYGDRRAVAPRAVVVDVLGLVRAVRILLELEHSVVQRCKELAPGAARPSRKGNDRHPDPRILAEGLSEDIGLGVGHGRKVEPLDLVPEQTPHDIQQSLLVHHVPRFLKDHLVPCL